MVQKGWKAWLNSIFDELNGRRAGQDGLQDGQNDPQNGQDKDGSRNGKKNGENGRQSGHNGKISRQGDKNTWVNGNSTVPDKKTKGKNAMNKGKKDGKTDDIQNNNDPTVDNGSAYQDD
jgi:hypothetical protein